MSQAVKRVIEVLALIAILFAIGMGTRMVALRLVVANYGVHAMLAAPFYALVTTAYAHRARRLWPLAVAALAYGAFLGMMSPVMAIAAIVPAVLALAAWHLLPEDRTGRRAIIVGIVYGALVYPATMIAGYAFGHALPSGGDVLYLAISAGLAAIGAIVADMLADKLAGRLASGKAAE